jgi:hypothetical protein
MKKTSWFAALMIATLVLVGCGPVNDFQPPKSPDEMVQEGMKRLNTVTSHQFDFKMNGDFTGPKSVPNSQVTLALKFSGGADSKQPKDPKLNLKADLNVKADGQNVAAAADLRLENKTAYVNLQKLDLPKEANLPKEIQTYMNKWWSIALGPYLDQLSSSLPLTPGSVANLTPEQKKIKEEFEKTKFFKDITYKGNETVKDEPSYAYTATLDKAAFMNFALKAMETQERFKQQPMTEQDKNELKKAMDGITFDAKLWVGQKSGILNKMEGAMKIKGAADTDPSGTLNFTMEMWGFNQGIKVEVPKDAIAFPVESLGALFSTPMIEVPQVPTKP